MQRVRISFPGAFHHAMSRGHGGEKIFYTSKMKEEFIHFMDEKAKALKAQSFNRSAISSRGLQYERLDQLTIDLLLDVR